MAINSVVIKRNTLRTSGEPPFIAICEPIVEPITFEIASAIPIPHKIAPCLAKINNAAKLVATLVNFAIAEALKKVDPAGAAYYDQRKADFEHRIDVAMFGEDLVKLVGIQKLTRLAWSGSGSTATMSGD